jgi:hypothetical protein
MHSEEAFLFVKHKYNQEFVPESPKVEDFLAILRKVGERNGR